MLLPLMLSLAFAVAGALIVAKVALVAMRRLGLDLFSVLIWFGIAEAPRDDVSLRRTRLAAVPMPGDARPV